MKEAEREGFEPPVPFDITGFQDQRLQPLGHLSVPMTASSKRQIIISFYRTCVNRNTKICCLIGTAEEQGIRGAAAGRKRAKRRKEDRDICQRGNGQEPAPPADGIRRAPGSRSSSGGAGRRWCPGLRRCAPRPPRCCRRKGRCGRCRGQNCRGRPWRG